MENCVFCKIIAGEMPAKFVYQDDLIVALPDIKPAAPVHILIVPKKHTESLKTTSEEDQVLLGKMLLIAGKIAKDLGISESGFKVVINNGPDAGQLVKHLHFHLLGGWAKNEGRVTI